MIPFYFVLETTAKDDLEVTTLSRKLSIETTQAPTPKTSSAVTPAKPPTIFLTCNELFLKGMTPRPGVNCIHTAINLGKGLFGYKMFEDKYFESRL